MVQIRRGSTWEIDCPFYKITQRSIIEAESWQQLVDVLTPLIAWNFEEPVHLDGWVDVLNKLDTTLSDIAQKHPDLFLNKDYRQWPGDGNYCSFYIKVAHTVLQFTTTLLTHSRTKDRFNSIELLYLFLRSWNDELAIAALRTIAALALAPRSHRYMEACPHNTSIETQHELYCSPLMVLFEIATTHLGGGEESAFYSIQSLPSDTCSSSSSSSKDTSDEDVCDVEHLKALLNINDHCEGKYEYNWPVNEAIFPIGSTSTVDSVCTSEFEVEQKSPKDGQGSISCPLNLSFVWLWHGRFIRMAKNCKLEAQICRIHCLYSVLFILFQCSPDTLRMVQLLEEKPMLWKDFIYIIQRDVTPSDSDTAGVTNARHVQALQEIRILACECLAAIADNNVAMSLLHRLPALQYELGIGKSQYMGLLPCLLRDAVAYMISPIDDSNSLIHSHHPYLDPTEASLTWVEHLFTLCMVLVWDDTPLVTLTESGLISSLLLILKNKPSQDLNSYSHRHIYIEGLAMQILDAAINNSEVAFTVFLDLQISENVLERLGYEVLGAVLPDRYGVIMNDPSIFRNLQVALEGAPVHSSKDASSATSLSTLSQSKKVYIQTLLTLLVSYFDDVQCNSPFDQQHSELFRSEMFSPTMSVIFSHPGLFGSSAMESAYRLIGDLIQHDPSPPVVLTHLISSNLAKHVLQGLQSTVQPLLHSNDSLLAATALITGVALTSEGVELLLATDIFTHIFQMFRDAPYVYPTSALFMPEIPGNIGSFFEQLFRYHPLLVVPCMTGMLKELMTFLDQTADIDVMDTDSLLKHFYYLTSTVHCLERLLVLKDVANFFMKSGGLCLLFLILSRSLGSSRCLLTALCAITDINMNATPHMDVGYFPVFSSLRKCIKILFAAAPRSCMVQLREQMEFLKGVNSTTQTMYYEQYVRPHVGIETNGPKARSVKRFEGFLSTMHSSPLQECSRESDGELTDQLHLYAKLLKNVILVDFAFETLGTFIQLSAQFNACEFAPENIELSAPSAVELLNHVDTVSSIECLLNDFYLPAIEEQGHARQLMSTVNTSMIKEHPIYTLLLLSPGAPVLESVEDSSKLMYNIIQGTVIEANECAMYKGMLKYHLVDGGWVNAYRYLHKTPEDSGAQVIVLSVRRQSVVSPAPSTLQTPQQQVECQKLLAMSPLRAGLCVMNHLHLSTKRLLGFISTTMNQLTLFKPNIVKKRYEAVQHIASVTSIIAEPVRKLCSTYVPLISSCIVRLIELSLASSTADVVNCMRNSEPITMETILNHQNSTNTTFENISFVELEIPTIEEFDVCNAFASMHLMELVYCLFNEKMAFNETHVSAPTTPMNVLIMTCLVYTHQIDCILYASVQLFLSSLHPTSSPLSGHSTSEDGTRSGVCHVPSAELGVTDRCVFATSKLDLLCALWKSLILFAGRGVTPMDKLLYAFADPTHAFDPYVLRRVVALTVVKHVHQTWSHPLLYTLPGEKVKSVLGLSAAVFANFDNIRLFPKRYVAQDRHTEVCADIRTQLRKHDGFDDDEASGCGSSDCGSEMSDVFDGAVPESSLEYCLLPDIFPLEDDQLNCLRDMVNELDPMILKSLPGIFLTIIQYAPTMGQSSIDGVCAGCCMDNRRYLLNVPTWNRTAMCDNINDDGVGTTLTIPDTLSLMFKCLQFSISEFFLWEWIVIVLTLLYQRAIVILSSGKRNYESIGDSTDESGLYHEQWVALGGLLEAIVLLLSSDKFAQRNYCQEAILLYFRMDANISPFYPLLVKQLEMEYQYAQTDLRDKGGSCCLSQRWLVPAFLIMGIFTKPIVVDHDKLGKAFADITLLDDEPLSGRLSHICKASFGFKCDSIGDCNTVLKYPLFTPSPTDDYRTISCGFPAEVADCIDDHAVKDTIPFKNRKANHPAGVNDTLTCEPTALVYIGHSERVCRQLATQCLYWIEHFPGKQAPVLPEKLVLEGTKWKKVGGIAQGEHHVSMLLPEACIRFLVHVVGQFESIRCDFVTVKGIDRILHSPIKFYGLSSVFSTLIQRVMEDTMYLTLAMQSTIRLCFNIVLKAKIAKMKHFPTYRLPLIVTDTKHVKLSDLLKMVKPLIFRNQQVFKKALTETTTIVQNRFLSQIAPGNDHEDESSMYACLRVEVPSDFGIDVPPSDTLIGLPSAERSSVGSRVAEKTKCSDVVEATCILAEAETVEGGTKLPKKGAHRTNANANEGPGSTAVLPTDVMFSTMESLMLRVLSQWTLHQQVVTECQQRQANYAISSSGYYSTITIPANASITCLPVMSICELLVIIADLVCAIPALAKCAVEYQFSQIAHPFSHCLNDELLLSSSFLSLLVHQLLTNSSPRTTLQHGISAPKGYWDEPESDTIQVQFISRTLVSVQLSSGGFCLPEPEEWNDSVAEISHCLVGSYLVDSVSYLLSALISCPGDGKRVVHELVSTLRVHSRREAEADVPGSDTANTSGPDDNTGSTFVTSVRSLYALSSINKVLHDMIHVPTNWTKRDTFTMRMRIGRSPRKWLTLLACNNVHELLLHFAVMLDVNCPSTSRVVSELLTTASLVYHEAKKLMASKGKLQLLATERVPKVSSYCHGRNGSVADPLAAFVDAHASATVSTVVSNRPADIFEGITFTTPSSPVVLPNNPSEYISLKKDDSDADDAMDEVVGAIGAAQWADDNRRENIGGDDGSAGQMDHFDYDDEVVLDVDNINDDEWERSTTPIQLSPSFCFGDMNLAHDHSDGLPDSTFGDVVFDEDGDDEFYEGPTGRHEELGGFDGAQRFFGDLLGSSAGTNNGQSSLEGMLRFFAAGGSSSELLSSSSDVVDRVMGLDTLHDNNTPMGVNSCGIRSVRREGQQHSPSSIVPSDACPAPLHPMFKLSHHGREGERESFQVDPMSSLVNDRCWGTDLVNGATAASCVNGRSEAAANWQAVYFTALVCALADALRHDNLVLPCLENGLESGETKEETVLEECKSEMACVFGVRSPQTLGYTKLTDDSDVTADEHDAESDMQPSSGDDGDASADSSESSGSEPEDSDMEPSSGDDGDDCDASADSSESSGAESEDSYEVDEENFDEVDFPPMRRIDSAFSFLSSLSEDMRREVLLAADDEFLSTLPPAIRAEAFVLRQEGEHATGLESTAGFVADSGVRSGSDWDSTLSIGPTTVVTVLPGMPVTGTTMSLQADRLPLSDSNCNECSPFDGISSIRIILLLALAVGPSRRPKKQLLYVRTMMKLLADNCRFLQRRSWILGIYVSLLSHDSSQLLACCQGLSGADNATVAQDTWRLIGLISPAPDADVSAGIICHVLSMMSYFVREVPGLVWYDMVQHTAYTSLRLMQCGVSSIPFSPPAHSAMGAVIALLKSPKRNMDIRLPVDRRSVQISDRASKGLLTSLDELLSPFQHYSVKQVNTLVADVIVRLGRMKDRIDGIHDGGMKRKRSDSDYPAMETARTVNNADSMTDVIARLYERRDWSFSMAPLDFINLPVYLPFPVLESEEAAILSSLSSGSFRSIFFNDEQNKRLLRVLKTLSLADLNWTLLLKNLADVATSLLDTTLKELLVMHGTLKEVVMPFGDTNIRFTPYMSTSSKLPDLNLLGVLRLMTTIRMVKITEHVDHRKLSDVLKSIPFGKLWDIMCESLDMVRRMEGLIDDCNADKCMEDRFGSGGRSSVSGAKADRVKQVPMSSLTMRFMPLIECFFTVCGITIMKLPDSEPVDSSGIADTRDESASKKAKVDDSSSKVTDSSTVSLRSTVSTVVLVPGDKFRMHDTYRQMQMELEEGPMGDRLVSFAEQNRDLLNMLIRQNISLLESSFAPLMLLPRCRHSLSFDVRRDYFNSRLQRLRVSHGAFGITVSRGRIFEDSFQKLRYTTAENLKRRLSITFAGEEGMDAGGLTREWYSVISRDIFSPSFVLFTSAADGSTFQPNPHSHINPDHLAYFKFVGRIIGKGLFDGHLLDAHFTQSFYKHILGTPVNYHDLKAIEPDYYKSLTQILELPLELLGLELDFSAESNEFGVIKTVDLIPNGRYVPVTDENKHEYVQLIANRRMTSAIQQQINAFLEGFHELVPAELVSIFDAQELELLISGLPDIDIDDLRAHTDYHGYKSGDPYMGHFWNTLKSFSKEEMALFLQFVTGTCKVPLDGFGALQGADGLKQFNIHKAYGGIHTLPSAHTCFNQLDLPEYASETVLREKLLLAVREGSEYFGFA